MAEGEASVPFWRDTYELGGWGQSEGQEKRTLLPFRFPPLLCHEEVSHGSVYVSA